MFRFMMRWAPRTNTIARRRLLACSLLLAVLACAALPGVSESAATRKLRGPGFSTLVPKSWKVTRQKSGDTRTYQAAAPPNRPNVSVNSMSLGVVVTSVKSFERQLGHKLPRAPEDFIGQVVGGPQGTQAQTLVPPRATKLDGARAASVVLQYIYNNAMILQSDTLCVRHGRIYVIELDIDTVKQFDGLPVLEKARAHWRWH
jgi:hypothetical protein